MTDFPSATSPPASGARGDVSGALAGLRVLEVGHLIGGPFCGHLFADHGADVIKVEPPITGDPLRSWGGLYKNVGLYWPVLARGKRSLTLDLRASEAREAFLALAKTADVVVENFRPGTLERWGLSPEELHDANPRLIVARVSGFGQTGPYRDRPAYGVIAEALSGFRHLCGEPGRPSVRVGISLADSLAGTQAFIGALLSLYVRDGCLGTGTGQVVDVALLESMWMYMESALPEYEKLGAVRGPSGSRLPGIAPSNTYSTLDAEWVVIGANQDSVFRRLALAVGHIDWLEPTSPLASHEGRGLHQDELDEHIQAWTEVRNADEVVEVLSAADVPVAKIYTAADVAEDPHFQRRDMIIEIEEPTLNDEPVRMQGVVPKLSGTPGRVLRGGPLLGEHNDEVWPTLLGEQRYLELVKAGVI